MQDCEEERCYLAPPEHVHLSLAIASTWMLLKVSNRSGGGQAFCFFNVGVVHVYRQENILLFQLAPSLFDPLIGPQRSR